MKWHRIETILLHSWYHGTHSLETWIDLVWFTFIQMIVFGFMSRVLAGNQHELASNLMMGFLLWEIVRIGQYCVSVSLMWEVWSHSLGTMFVTPLTLKEMMTGQMISGTLKTLCVIFFLNLISATFFSFSIFTFGWMLLIYIPTLLVFSFAMGVFICGLIIRFGTDIQSLAWGLIFLFQPISALYYPVEALPAEIRWLAFISPLTHIMETARLQYYSSVINWGGVFWAIVLTLLYFALGSWFMNKMYLRAKHTGSFARLGN